MYSQCWVYNYSGTTSWMNGISFSDAKYGLIVGDAGTVRQTKDGGTTWLTHNFKMASPFYAVDCIDSTTATMVGYNIDEASGMIYHTTNGGAAWSRQNSGTQEVLNAVAFLNRDTGFTVGTGGTILFTTNGGSAWRPRVSGTTTDLRGVAVLTRRNALAVGGYGLMLRTTNTGSTWTPIPTGFGALNAITFVDSTTGYVVGSNGTILKSTNGGIDWIDLSINSEYFFYAVSFIDSIRGTAVGFNKGNGIIAHTTDGGANWQRISIPGNALFGVAVHDSTKGTAVGWNGGILHEFSDCSQTGWFAPLLPANGSSHEPLVTLLSLTRSATLQWNLLPDIEVTGTFVQLAADSTFASNIVVNTLVTLKASLITRKLVVQNLHPGTTYYWKLKIIYDNGDSTAWSDVWKFTTASGNISGQVFEDANRDSLWNPGERSLQAWQVDLIGETRNSTMTDSLGRFVFSGIDSGNYTVNAGLPLVWSRTVPSDTSYEFALLTGDSLDGFLFGNYFPWNTVSGTVFDDKNENGIQDAGDPGLPYWRVRVQGNTNDSVLTDDNGNFVFPHLTLGTLHFTAVAQQSWEQINPQLGGGYSLVVSSYGQHYAGKNFSIHRIPPRVKLTLFVKDNSLIAYRNIWWGLRDGATSGIWGADPLASTVDFAEGEFDLPPQLFGLFDARFEDPTSSHEEFGYGSWTDMRPYYSPSQIDTYRVTFAPAYYFGGDYPMTLQWSKTAIDTSYSGTVLMSDALGNTANMKVQDNFVITDTSVKSVTIIARNPRMPVLSVEEHSIEMPQEFALLQNYPNPFNPTTVIRYQIPVISAVKLTIYNLLGQAITIVVDERQEAGYKSVEWNAPALPSGVYFYRLIAGNFSEVRKMVLLR